MQVKRVKCPQCGVVLDVKNSKNEEVKQITCPSCCSVLQVKFSPNQVPLEAETYYAPKTNNADQGETQLISNQTKISLHASLFYNDIEYPLAEGQNIVGRKGATSKATIQIDTSDRYMSRQHCSITVKTLPDGDKKVMLSNYQNKNLTIVDSLKIDSGDIVRLSDGNIIKMGHTSIIFKMS